MATEKDYASEYAAAKLLDLGRSSRTAAKESGINRRQAAEIARRAQDSGLGAAETVITGYLTDTDEADGRGSERTTSEIALTMNAGSLDEIKSKMRLLERKGIVVNAKDERERASQETAQETGQATGQATGQTEGAPQAGPGTEPEPQPPDDEAGDRTTWVPEAPEDHINLLNPQDWPGRKSNTVIRAVENLNYQMGVLEEKPYLDPLPSKEEIVLNYILNPHCRRVLLSEEDTHRMLAAAQPGTGTGSGSGTATGSGNAPAAPWPVEDTIYIEAHQPLEVKDGTIFHGYLVAPGEGHRPVVSVSEKDHRMQLGILYVDLETGTARCGSEHSGMCNPHIHTEQAAAAVSIARMIGDRGLTELPLSRQQRRLVQRKGLTNPWHVITPEAETPPPRSRAQEL